MPSWHPQVVSSRKFSNPSLRKSLLSCPRSAPSSSDKRHKCLKRPIPPAALRLSSVSSWMSSRNASQSRTARGEIITGITNNPRLELNLRNIERFLDQMRYDPSISKKLLDEWKTMPTHNLETQDAKYQYASLYAQLVTEWQSAEK